ncbi:hypothetical protein [Nonomuraea fuscirosea]|uniref:hypothetical protein n=1 Tax=Nonomuraea fuscirosea TaxID=1291556 RepID=UPI0033CAAFA9
MPQATGPMALYYREDLLKKWDIRCEHPREAVDFALWINRDPGSVETLIKSGYGRPAAVSGMSHPQLTKPSAFLGGQRTAGLCTASSNQVPKGWVWWPAFDDTVKILSDRVEDALSGRSTLVDALETGLAGVGDPADRAVRRAAAVLARRTHGGQRTRVAGATRA